MKNLYLLSTQNNNSKLASYIYDESKNIKVGELRLKLDISSGWTNCWNPKELYIVSDEKIKKGNWCLHKDGKGVICKVTLIFEDGDVLLNNATRTNPLNFRKIILTTDFDLIKNGVQSIDDEFLEWFVKNPSCEYVDVEKICQEEVILEWWENLSDKETKEVFLKTNNFRLGGWGHDIGPTDEDVRDMYLEIHNLNSKQQKFYYKIIIPKEQTKTGYSKSETKFLGVEFTLNDSSKQFIPKQETIEEAAERCFEEMKSLNPTGGLKEFIKLAVNFGAKWKQERMYSEEEVYIIIKMCVSMKGSGKTDIEIVEYFEQFKNK